MRIIVVDCLSVESESDFWETYVASIEPDGASCFGRNLDAFWDGLNGGPGWPGDCEIQFINTKHMQAFRNGCFLKALHDIASPSTFVKISFD
ncbi:barstar family protein [Paludibacterium purpuratum]|uniref:barstar family protein n=1 Tax=Paludibacterium purpuratum TaxID=1144873 RepID=UPI00105DF9D5|nr:barstar family protein [Paludibacterium purpuratum]